MTVLFADLVGFTTLAEGRDPEAVRELLSQYFDLATEVIGRYGGRVEKFIGDAVMALWGAPTAHEDDAERAVRAALDLVDAVREIGPGIQARCGVLTGEAAVTLGSKDQGMVAGDLVNTAARLQSAAAPGTVLVGETTHQATTDAVAYEPAGEHDLKGKALPVRRVARPADRRRAPRPRPRRPPRGPVRRPRLRAAVAQGPVPRDVARAAGSTRVDHRPGRDRQEPPGVGVPQVRRRRRRAGLVARGTIAVVRRGDHVLGAGRDGPVPGGAPRERRRGDDPCPDRRDARRARARRGRAPPHRAGLPRAPRRRRGASRRRARAVLGLADVLRAARGDRRGRAAVRGPALGGSRDAGLRGAPPRVEPQRPDPDHHPRPTGAARPPARLGRRQALLPGAGPAGARRGVDARAPRRASCPACRRPRSGRSSPAPRGSPCTRSRPSACWSRTGASWRAPVAATSRRASWASSRCRARCTR